jgi:hypothetical protein
MHEQSWGAIERNGWPGGSSANLADDVRDGGGNRSDSICLLDGVTVHADYHE